MSAYFVVPRPGSAPPANAAVFEVTVHVDMPSQVQLTSVYGAQERWQGKPKSRVDPI